MDIRFPHWVCRVVFVCLAASASLTYAGVKFEITITDIDGWAASHISNPTGGCVDVVLFVGKDLGPSVGAGYAEAGFWAWDDFGGFKPFQISHVEEALPPGELDGYIWVIRSWDDCAFVFHDFVIVQRTIDNSLEILDAATGGTNIVLHQDEFSDTYALLVGAPIILVNGEVVDRRSVSGGSALAAVQILGDFLIISSNDVGTTDFDLFTNTVPLHTNLYMDAALEAGSGISNLTHTATSSVLLLDLPDADDLELPTGFGKQYFIDIDWCGSGASSFIIELFGDTTRFDFVPYTREIDFFRGVWVFVLVVLTWFAFLRITRRGIA